MKVCLILGIVALATWVDATDPECAYRKDHGLAAHWANPTDCGRFYRCTNRGVKREITCTADKEYNAKTGKCVNRARGMCKLSVAAALADVDNVCSGKLDGTSLPQEGKCRDFYVCHENTAYSQSCDAGSVFSTDQLACVPDTNCSCWQNACVGKTDGTYVSDPTLCTSFYICKANEPVQQQCPEGSYFDDEDLNCRPGACPNNPTTPKPPTPTPPVTEEECTCPGGYADGEFLPHPESCELYYICSDSKLVLNDCGSGNFFDATLKVCRVDTNGVCPEADANGDASTEEPCECPSDTLWAVPDTCNKYYMCDGDTKIEKACSSGSYFDAAVNVCRVDANGVCPAAITQLKRSQRSALTTSASACAGGYEDGDFLPDSSNCMRFKICHEGELLAFSCGNGNYYSPTEKYCIRNENEVCSSSGKLHETEIHNAKGPESSCATLGNGATIANQSACNKFYTCQNNEQVDSVCPLGYFYDTTVGECVIERGTTCAAAGNLCTGRPDGFKFSNTQNCNGYYVCQNGAPVDGSCATGSSFWECKGTCVPDDMNTCTTVISCVGAPDGTLYPIPTDNTSFVVCMGGNALTNTCPTDTYFSPTAERCTAQPSDACDQSQCLGVTDISVTFPTLNPTDEPAAFCRCVAGVAIKDQCGAGTEYNSALGICLSTAPCNPNVCLVSPDFTITPNLQDPHSFCMCLSGQQVVQNCNPNHVYIPLLEICVEQNPNCDPTVCITQPDFLPFPALNHSDGFCYCSSGASIYETCPEGSAFDSSSLICLATCNVDLCVEAGLNFPTNNPTKFCHCLDTNTVKEMPCPTGQIFNSQQRICLPDCNDGEVYNPDTGNCDVPTDSACAAVVCVATGTNFPITGEPTKFCHCGTNGIAQEMSCSSDQIFNSIFNICLPNCGPNTEYNPDTGNCDSQSGGACAAVICVSTGTNFPITGEPTKFCHCGTDGIAQEMPCSSDQIFNTIFNICLPECDADHEFNVDTDKCEPTENVCPAIECVALGYNFPIVNRPSEFCHCGQDGNAQEMSCPTDLIFSTDYRICLLVCQDGAVYNPVTGNCDVPTDSACAAVVCVATGTNFPITGEPTKFCHCGTNGIAQEMSCSSDQIFNSIFNICLPNCGPNTEYNPDTGNCDSQSGGACAAVICVSTGTNFPITGEPTKFCHCGTDGIAQEMPCSSDEIFNTIFNICLPECDAGYVFNVVDGQCEPTENVCPAIECVAPGYNFPIVNRPSEFCHCGQDGNAQEMSCPTDLIFSTDYRICLLVCQDGEVYNPVTGNCDVPTDSACAAVVCVATGTNFPITGEPTKFCHCGTDGIAQEMSCLNDEKFSWIFNVCLPECDAGYVFNVVDGQCEPQTTDEVCPGGNCIAPGINFPIENEPTKFCYCLETGVAEEMNCPQNNLFSLEFHICVPVCPDGTVYDPVTGECVIVPDMGHCVGGITNGTRLPNKLDCTKYYECSHCDLLTVACADGYYFNTDTLLCDEDVNGTCATINANRCVGGYAPGAMIPHPTDPELYYVCESCKLELLSCGDGNVFDENTEACVKGNNQKVCPDGTVYDPVTGECVIVPDMGHCVGGITNGTRLPNKFDCTKYYECSHCDLLTVACADGYYFNTDTLLCDEDVNGTCATINANRCVGGYAPGAMIPHPTDPELYYVCESCKLELLSCGDGYVFDENTEACVNANNQKANSKPRSVQPDYDQQDQDEDQEHEREREREHDQLQDNDDLPKCKENEMRSVPSNCSQYEMCAQGKWLRLTCSQQHYYNAEEQVCMEPRDDTVCMYARVGGLPECNNATESRMHPAKGDNCGQYFRCTNSRWRLRSCARQQIYADWLQTCLSVLADGNGTSTSALPTNDADQNEEEEEESVRSHCVAARERLYGNHSELSSTKCHHTAVRFYGDNCAMYLMCMEGEWWYQYCPLDMYFNRTHNYCMPNNDGQCMDASSPTPHAAQPPATNSTADNEYAMETCSSEGLLRPSALRCDIYYVCVTGEWQPQSCAIGHYYSLTTESCVADTAEVCSTNSSAPNYGCTRGSTRSFPLNCTAYIECSGSYGEWQRAACPLHWAFDDVLGQCVPNDGTCSANGLRKACTAGERRPMALPENCTQFYYCDGDRWQVGSCLRGDTFANESLVCVAHSDNDKCLPAASSGTAAVPIVLSAAPCLGVSDGASVVNPDDCTRFYVCYQGTTASDEQCAMGSFFDSRLAYCRPNDGSCRAPLTGPCVNASYNTVVANPNDCRSYYSCSAVNGTQLLYCPDGQYYHNYTRQCRMDYGECHNPETESPSKCSGLEHGTRLMHEQYCNIYYACVRGVAIPVECPDNYQFSAAVGRCVHDEANQCQDGQLVNGTIQSYSCGNLLDGSYLTDRSDCTRYYICSMGVAQPQQCASGTFFDSQQLLCVPDDGSCPYVDHNGDDKPNHQPVPPDPIVCVGKHGNLMPDPLNCNDFYVCINGKLRHERCYTKHFFNTTTYQCQRYVELSHNDDDDTSDPSASDTAELKAQQQTCSDKPTEFAELCREIPEGGSIAEQGDCRKYLTCPDEEPVSQRCRNGESYDSVLGFCRQNDGTCLLENGQRVGDCNGLHGQLARDTANCRGYFVCIHGQKIAGTCASDEYYNRTQNVCQPDVLSQCSTSPANGSTTTAATITDTEVNCLDLSESMLYPHVHDNCRSYFQCIKGVAKVTECADGLYFDAASMHCVKEIGECAMPMAGAGTNPRSPDVSATHNQVCEESRDKPAAVYANIEDQCRSFFTCLDDGSVSYTNCPLGYLYSSKSGKCIEFNYDNDDYDDNELEDELEHEHGHEHEQDDDAAMSTCYF